LDLFEKLFSEIIQVFEIILFLDVKMMGFYQCSNEAQKM
jgi:hypothetical protein